MKISHSLMGLAASLACTVATQATTVAEVVDAITGDYTLGDTSLHAAQIELSTTPDAVYIELILKGHEMDARQLVLTFQQQGDEVSTRVYAFREEIGEVMAPDLSTLAVGLWAAPDLFPKIIPSQLDPIVDVLVEVDETGVRIALENAPIVRLNAELLDADLRFSEEGALWQRIGMDMERSEIWKEEIALLRTEIEPPVTRHDNGLVTIDIRPGAGVPLTEGDNVSFHYIGVLEDGRRFDSTQFPGRSAYGSTYPGKLFPPLAMGLDGIRCPEDITAENTLDQPIRKIIIPPSLGFGEEGRGPVPGGASMYYLTLVQSILDKTPGE